MTEYRNVEEEFKSKSNYYLNLGSEYHLSYNKEIYTGASFLYTRCRDAKHETKVLDIGGVRYVFCDMCEIYYQIPNV